MADVTGGQRVTGAVTPGDQGYGTHAEQEMGRMVAEIHARQKQRGKGH